MRQETVLDFVLSWMGDKVDRAVLQARITAWNTWMNLGFAITISELIEVVRLPVVFFLYYFMRPHSNHFSRWMDRFVHRLRCGKWTNGAAV
ncbi:hypothetical protein LBRM_33_2490 [Leishmania braziliensis MHOM/BR/75/M2904]|uniref:Uncharacterized protein n=2 Tax=Leishmania braziliensis TaxID=5660 RepID=A4HLT3_LEIBR|nr:hypothetical protein LBRM_33_2490 [Leishmania braziliensis MHOM/BR/75/M2904]CAJ2479580.1 unnamed protein product [Leishmania braziliensis]CAJ2479941.1 unnamed protein product [Leishmania braziliensis]CAM40779.1 hypothetical protein LBRM_33_2490 [Leishmania braziliensis MHOM/BR/75/M2904]SYZ69190.1 hypothetical_protein [Leishmania braziliensis MHOM/BR/75/M2904]